jgi:hypothetical protein
MTPSLKQRRAIRSTPSIRCYGSTILDSGHWESLYVSCSLFFSAHCHVFLSFLSLFDSSSLEVYVYRTSIGLPMVLRICLLCLHHHGAVLPLWDYEEGFGDAGMETERWKQARSSGTPEMDPSKWVRSAGSPYFETYLERNALHRASGG